MCGRGCSKRSSPFMPPPVQARKTTTEWLIHCMGIHCSNVESCWIERVKPEMVVSCDEHVLQRRKRTVQGHKPPPPATLLFLVLQFCQMSMACPPTERWEQCVCQALKFGLMAKEKQQWQTAQRNDLNPSCRKGQSKVTFWVTPAKELWHSIHRRICFFNQSSMHLCEKQRCVISDPSVDSWWKEKIVLLVSQFFCERVFCLFPSSTDKRRFWQLFSSRRFSLRNFHTESGAMTKRWTAKWFLLATGTELLQFAQLFVRFGTFESGKLCCIMSVQEPWTYIALQWMSANQRHLNVVVQIQHAQALLFFGQFFKSSFPLWIFLLFCHKVFGSSLPYSRTITPGCHAIQLHSDNIRWDSLPWGHGAMGSVTPHTLVKNTLSMVWLLVHSEWWLAAAFKTRLYIYTYICVSASPERWQKLRS